MATPTRFGQGGAAAKGTAPAAPRKGRFAGVDLNSGGGRLPHLPFDSTSTVEVLSTELKTVSGNNVVTIVKVLESTDPSAKPGAQYAYVQPLGDQWGYGEANFGRFVVACGNLDDAGIAEMLADAEDGVSVADAACGVAAAVEKHGENPLAGCMVSISVTRGKQDDKGNPYPNYSFAPVAGA